MTLSILKKNTIFYISDFFHYTRSPSEGDSTMNPVEYRFKLTIHLWTGAAPAQYASESRLRDIWSVPGEAYEPVGIHKLMHQNLWL